MKNADPPELDPKKYGWKIDVQNKSLSPATVPEEVHLRLLLSCALSGGDVRVTHIVLLSGVVVTMQGCHVLCSVHVTVYAVLTDMLHKVIMYDISHVNAHKHHKCKHGSSNI